jgi:hypothetical protein
VVAVACILVVGAVVLVVCAMVGAMVFVACAIVGAAVPVDCGALWAWVGAVVAVVDAAGEQAARDSAKMNTRDRATFVLLIHIEPILFIKMICNRSATRERALYLLAE